MVLTVNMNPIEPRVAFTAAEEVTFFTHGHQMGFPARTHNFMIDEGFGTIASLYEMDDDILDTLASNARKPAATVALGPQPNDANANPPLRVPVSAYVMGAKSLARLKVAHRAVKYYALTKRAINPAAMTWSVLKIFDENWKIIEEKIKN